MPPLSFGGHGFHVVGKVALYWPAQNALIVSDLHLEKGSWFAARGQMLPPHDSLATLERIAQLIVQTGVGKIWCLGDNFHDDDGPLRLSGDAALLLARMTTETDWHWVTGNHDENLPHTIGGTITEEAEVDGIILRHRAVPQDGRFEMSGHFHPKYRAQGVRGRVTRPCFVISPSKIIFPAFGAFTGGLYADHPEILASVPGGAEAIVSAGDRLLRFPLSE
jgi:uncharacterized protein